MSRMLPRLFSNSPSLDALKTACSRTAVHADYPLAASIKHNIPIYKLPAYASLDAAARGNLQDEWYRVLVDGPGVFVTSELYKDKPLLDQVTSVYKSIITAEKQQQQTSRKGDHFAAGGRNDRIWNSLGKHALADPASFVRYYANPWLALVCATWLGPGYRVTAQVNSVRPGGSPQTCHADYHLGFQGPRAAARFPRGAHHAGQFLTLQGAVAHVDVPLASGPTRLLPFSQAVEGSYLAYGLPEVAAYFEEEHVSLPLGKGDGLFFNPALFHAAGANRSSDVERLVNLLQVSSAFGKPMEVVETRPVVESCWDHLLAMCDGEGAAAATADEVASAVAAIGEGYPFPTNLDRNSPDKDDMTPPSEQDILARGLRERKSKEQVLLDLEDLAFKSRA